MPPRYTYLILTEFVYSQQELRKDIQPFIFNLLSQTLVENKLLSQLLHLIQNDFLPDSITLAQTLSTQGPNSPLFQIAIDMFKRMECHHDVLALLVSCGQLIDALQYARKTNSLQYLSPIPFLDHALQTGDKTLFLNIYKLFEDCNLIPKTAVSDPNFVAGSKNGLARFVSIYREIWGPLIKMEHM